MKVFYLHHSGVLVLLDDLTLIFDPISSIPQHIYDKNDVKIFLISHGHHDHYDPKIWLKNPKRGENNPPKVFYVISDDIKNLPPHEDRNVALVKPYTHLDIDNTSIFTLGSTDQGVSFLVEHEGEIIFFAGDLNWWAWNTSSHPNIDPVAEERDYKREIQRLKKMLDGKRIDLACVPVDPRLDLPGGAFFAADYFIKELAPKKLLPIHFWGDYDIIRRLEKQLPKDCPTEIGEVISRNEYVIF